MYSINNSMAIIAVCKFSTYADTPCNNAQVDDWDDLRFFVAIARNGSVTRAATKLGVNHSTVSRRIQAFEKKHNVRLFERVPTGYVMTQEAENIYQMALDIEQRSQDIERQLFGQDNRLHGKVVITAPNYIINNVLMPHVPDFQKSYPSINIQFHASPDLQNMAAREADIAIRITSQPPETLIGRKVADLSYGLYATKHYWKSNAKQHKVILLSNDATAMNWLQNDFIDAQVVLHTNSIETMAAAVSNGIGIANLPCIVGETHKKLYRLTQKLTQQNYGVWILSHADLRSTARIRVTREFLNEILLAYKSSFEGKKSHYLNE